MVNASSKRNRAQVSMEYLIIFGIAFAMTLPLIVIYAQQTLNTQADITEAQTYNLASRISDYAQEVYYMGPPSQRTLNVDFPDGINSITLNNSLIIFNVTTSDLTYDVVMETSANLTGSISSFSGPHTLVFVAQDGYVNITDK